jgi:mitofusin 2
MITPTTENGPQSPMCLMQNNEIITQEQLSVISRIAVASIGSQGTVGGLLVAGLVSGTLFSFLFSWL